MSTLILNSNSKHKNPLEVVNITLGKDFNEKEIRNGDVVVKFNHPLISGMIDTGSFLKTISE